MITRNIKAYFFILLSLAISLDSLAIAKMRLHPAGVGSETVNLCTLRDRYGFLWVGTTTGLACFDGNGLSANRNLSGIIRPTSNLRINTLFEHDNDIWFAYPTGLMVFDRNLNRTYRFPHKTKYGVEISSRVDKILKTGDDNVWIITQGQGLFIFNDKTKKLDQDSRHGSFFSDAETGSDGYVYIASLDGEIKKFHPKGDFISSHTIPGYVPNKSRISLESQGSDIWISSSSNLYRLDTSSGKIEYRHSTPSAGTITSLLSHTPGHLLLGTTAGILDYNILSGSSSHLDISKTQPNSENPDTRINQLVKDSDGNIIVVSTAGEINVLSTVESSFNFISIDSPQSTHNYVYALCSDPKGKGFWIGSDNGLNFYNFATGQLTAPDIPDTGAHTVSSITADGETLWIGTAQNGLILHNTLSGETRRFHYDENIPYSLMSDEISDVFITSSGETFVLTQWGICRYDHKTSDFHTLREMGQQTQVVTMAEDNDGGLWAASVNNGLFYRKPKGEQFDLFNSKTINKSIVTIMLLGRDGTLWAATQEDGIYRFSKDAGDFIKFDIPFLSGHVISTMEEDNNGTLWVTSGHTLVKVIKEGNVDFNFSRMLFRTPVLRSSATLPSGDIAVGCSNGVQIFNPFDMQFTNGKVSTFPTFISFPFMRNNEETLQSLGVNTLLYTQDKITLPYGHNTFTIHLAANHPSELPQVNFDYMLEGVDKGWTIGTARQEVTYNNLSPGTYRFMVRPNGLPDAEVKVLSIRISPPWYRTMWAYIVYGILMLIMVFVIAILTRRQVRRHYNRRIDNLRTQKEREVWEAKMKFFVDLVHEIRTPLMLISLPLEHLAKKFKEMHNGNTATSDNSALTKNMDDSRRYLGSMQNNLNYLLGITNQLLDFRNVGTDNETPLYISECNLNDMLSRLCSRFEDPMITENKSISLSLPQNTVTAYIDVDKTERILMNLIGNARKYCTGKVEVSLANDDVSVRITVADDGAGIPEEERKNIFTRYYQIKGDKIAASLGTGLGLAYAKQIARRHKGDIRVGESESGGARFELTLPIGQPSEKNEPAIAECNRPQNGSGSDNANCDTQIITSQAADNEIPELYRGGGEGTSVLVVDDNRELREMICEGLENTYQVVTAPDGVEALEILRNQDIDFIVSDVMMPRMDGIELLRQVKSDINTSHIPFIILTAKTSYEARAEGMTEGADIYLDKPFSISNLILQIENIRRTRQFFYARRRGTEPLPDVDQDLRKAIKEEQLPAINKYDAEFLGKMEHLMEENISDEEFSIDVLAERLNMSRSSFYRKLKALMGMTPVDYMKNYRLDMAARQLREGFRVTEVVDNVGFTSSSYFAKCFREKYGVLPRDYVASLKAN